MPNACAKTVYSPCMNSWKTCVQLFTGTFSFVVSAMNQWVKAATLPLSSPLKTTWFSTPFPGMYHLFEHVFYPLSTIPITRATNLN